MRRLTEKIRRSYAVKLLVVFGLIAVLVGTFAAAAADSTASVAEDRAEAQLSGDAADRAAALEQWSAGVERRAAQFASAPAVVDGDTDAVDDRLSELAGELGAGVVAIHYAVDGEAVASTAPSGSFPVGVGGVDGPTYTEPYAAEGVNGQAVAYVHPTDEGALVYVLTPAAVVGDTGGDDTANAGGDSASETTYLVDESQTVVAATADGAAGASFPAFDGAVTAAAGGEGDPTVVERESFAVGAAADGESTTGSEATNTDGTPLIAAAGVAGTPWAVAVQTDAATAFGVADYASSAVVGVALLTLVSLVLFGSTVGSTTVIQTRDLESRADRVADGELDLGFPTRRRDEFGAVRQSMDVMRRTLTEEIQAAEAAEREAENARNDAEALSTAVTETAESYATELEAAAAGDLTRRVDTGAGEASEADGVEAIHRVGVSVNELLAEYEETIRELSAFAEDVTDAAADVEGAAGEATTVADRISERLSEIETDATTQRDEVASLATEIDQLSATAEEIAATTGQVESASETTAAAARDGSAAAETAIEEVDETVQTLDETVAVIDELASRVDRVGEVVELISDVADETDMLAVNASIEAARAGGDGSGAGDGFAVVAEEVKALAEEAKESADEVSEQLEAIRAQTDVAVETADDADETLATAADTVESALTQLGDIAEYAEQTDDSVAEISRATSEQAESTQAASEVVADVRAISEQTASDADSLVDAADEQARVIDTVVDTAETLAADAERLQASLDGLTVRGGTTDATETTVSTPTATDD